MNVVLTRSPYVIPGLIIPSMSEETKKLIHPSMVMNIVADYFKLAKVSLTDKSRRQTIVYPRMIAMYLIRENTNLSLKEVVELFEPAIINHTSVIHSENVVKDQLSLPHDNSTKQDIVNITKILFNYTEAINNILR